MHEEIKNHLKQIDKLRASAQNHSNTIKIQEIKKRLAKILKIHVNLKELLANVRFESIETLLELLIHKFNTILTEGDVSDLFNEKLLVMPKTYEHVDVEEFRMEKNAISSMYLDDILKQCTNMKQEKLDKYVKSIDCTTLDNLNAEKTHVKNDIVWPGEIDTFECHSDDRKYLKVDLKRLTTEEAAMIESIGQDCVSDIIDNLLKRNL